VNNTKFYSNGKLLLTGEYVVLDGALSLALPTRYGQSLTVKPINDSKLFWKSYDENNIIWFEDEFDMKQIASGFSNFRNDVSKRLIQILHVAQQLNPDFLSGNNGFKVESKLSFSRTWGLGSSSTLINNIANWAKVNAYHLLENSFGGSGYDIACAQHNAAITYQLIKPNGFRKNKQNVSELNFNPNFKECLYFVYLNKKQNSKEGIERYRKNVTNISKEILEINAITQKMIKCKHLEDFEALLNRHERIISKLIGMQPVKSLLFKDFEGSIKSLGAWGGDFVLTTSNVNPLSYFKNKGFETVIPFDQMILK
jgi:mevalonate kinase